MPKVMVVSAFVPLKVKHLTAADYHRYGDDLIDAVGFNRTHILYDTLTDCWLYGARFFPPAQPVPADRYETPQDMVNSNIVQHNRTQWACEVAELNPGADVIVWLDYAIMKQGGWTGKPVTRQVVRDFIDKIENGSDLTDIPFPGIWRKGPIVDHGDNWRFCGSTHIWPRRWLAEIDRAYKIESFRFIGRVGAIPNDLPIWAAVEANWPDLPFRWYAANHDATQLSNY